MAAPRSRARKRRKATVTSVDRTAADFSMEAVIDSMRPEHIQCRDFQHSWRPFTAHRAKNGSIDQVLRCSRCLTRRHRVLSRTGAVVASNYEYADNYIIKGLGRVTGSERDHLRLVSAMRTLVEDTADDT